jgi:hypothetical protein
VRGETPHPPPSRCARLPAGSYSVRRMVFGYMDWSSTFDKERIGRRMNRGGGGVQVRSNMRVRRGGGRAWGDGTGEGGGRVRNRVDPTRAC